MSYILEPEVAGQIGAQSILDSSTFPPKVEKLHYEFDGWLGDSIIESFPCFIVTEELADKIANEKLSGYLFEQCIIAKSETFNEIMPRIALPRFLWLKVSGIVGKDDFAISSKNQLVVSEAALRILQLCKLDNCDIEVYGT